MQEYLTQVLELKYLTLDVVELTVRLLAPDEIEFTAGQFMQFKIGDQTRAYSIASPPSGIDSKQLVFVIKLLPHGPGSDFVRQLKVGDDLVLRGPLGVFTIQNFQKPVFCVATGVGVAPFAAMIPDMLVRGYREPLRLLFGLRSEEKVFYYDKFTHLASLYDNFKFIPILSRPQSHWPGETGRVTTYLEVSYGLLKNYAFYVCGSAAMIEDSKQILLAHGLDPKSLKTEVFF